MSLKLNNQRTCIVCRKTFSKGDFLRVVRTPEGEVCFDPSGRRNGRGAYVCSLACCQHAYKSRAFDRALRVKLRDEDYERIAQEIIDAQLDEKQ